MDYSLIILMIFCFAQRLSTERSKKSIKQTKNAPFHPRSENGPQQSTRVSHSTLFFTPQRVTCFLRSSPQRSSCRRSHLKELATVANGGEPLATVKKFCCSSNEFGHTYEINWSSPVTFEKHQLK